MKHFETLSGKSAATHDQLKVSIVTPSYKQLAWLKLCTASVADQQGVDVEHIIQDAQSGPEVEDWVRCHTRAQLHVEADTGMYDAINRGFARASGDILSWLNCDEQLLPGTLAKVACFFEENPGIDVLFGDALLVDEKGDLLSYRRTIAPNIGHIQATHLNVLTCATFVRRSVFERGFGLPTRWKAIADAVWIVDLLKARVPMAIVREPLASFTITDSNLGQTSLAFAESKIWQSETSPGNKWLRPYFVLQHRLGKLLHGAYRLRKVSTELYTFDSSQKRVRKEKSRLGFSWPRAHDLVKPRPAGVVTNTPAGLHSF